MQALYCSLGEAGMKSSFFLKVFSPCSWFRIRLLMKNEERIAVTPKSIILPKTAKIQFLDCLRPTMFTVYSSLFTRKKHLRRCHIPHKGMFRRPLNVRMNDCGAEAVGCFCTAICRLFCKQLFKTVEGICVWIRG